MSSSVVSWSFCSEFWSPAEGPNCADSCVSCRDNVRLTIIHCVSVPMPLPTTCWAPAHLTLAEPHFLYWISDFLLFKGSNIIDFRE